LVTFDNLTMTSLSDSCTCINVSMCGSSICVWNTLHISLLFVLKVCPC